MTSMTQRLYTFCLLMLVTLLASCSVERKQAADCRTKQIVDAPSGESLAAKLVADSATAGTHTLVDVCGQEVIFSKEPIGWDVQVETSSFQRQGAIVSGALRINTAGVLREYHVGDRFFIPQLAVVHLSNIGKEPLVMVEVYSRGSVPFDGASLDTIAQQFRRERLMSRVLRFDLPTF